MNIRLLKGDITTIEADVIVNAANNSLLGGGGVDGAIHRAGGPEILEECKKLDGCPTGEAVMTTAGDLPAKKVIHTVGPIWEGGANNERELLKSAYRNSLKLALDEGFNSIVFPSISTGVYGFPKKEAAAIAVDTVKEFQEQNTDLLEVTFVCFDEENYQIYQRLFGMSVR